MTYKALFLGSIGVVAETSELQREAFNIAFDRFGLDWNWDRDTYYGMLSRLGGQARIAAYAAERGQEVEARAIYATKQSAFQSLLRAKGVAARPGVKDLLKEATAQGLKRAFATSTSAVQVDAVLDGLKSDLPRRQFDFIGDRAMIAMPKPAADIYYKAMQSLDVAPQEVLVVEDTPESAEAALSAGLRVVGFPGCAARERAFPDGVPVVEFLTPMLLRSSPVAQPTIERMVAAE
ncbi:MAG: HAD-IA family hydrolase [Pseudomonadota bacterium]